VRFKSDSQRKAVFSNIFSGDGKFSLYLDSKSKRVRSTVYPTVDFDLDVSVSGVSKRDARKDAIKFLNYSLDEIPEYDYAGLSRLVLAEDINHEGGSDNHGVLLGSYADRGHGIDEFENMVPKDFVSSKEYRRLKKSWLDRFPEIGLKSDQSFEEGVDTAAHELGHYIVGESGLGVDWRKGYECEPPAELYASNITGGKLVYKMTEPERKKFEDMIDYSEALQKLKNPSIEELMVVSKVE